MRLNLLYKRDIGAANSHLDLGDDENLQFPLPAIKLDVIFYFKVEKHT